MGLLDKVLHSVGLKADNPVDKTAKPKKPSKQQHQPPPPKATTRGLYIWGNNTYGLISENQPAATVEPQRVSYFDNQKLRCVALSPFVAVAATANGDVVGWTKPTNQEVIIKGKDIVRLGVSGSHAVALGNNGRLYGWDTGLGDPPAPSLLWADPPVPEPRAVKVHQFELPTLGWFEKITDIKTGESHITALTSRGRALTGFFKPVEKHDGQIGLASFPAFEPAPEPYKMHFVKLLSGVSIAQVACGANHTLFRSKDGQLYGCGSNTFGQLMLPYTFKAAQVSVPTELFARIPGRAPPPTITDVAAGGEVTYIQTATNETLVAGNGIHAQFGTGSLAHNQSSPLHIPSFENLSEFDEKTNASRAIRPQKFVVGLTHTFAMLDNSSKDWLVWGGNNFGQLCTAKKSKAIKPLYLQRLSQADSIVGDTFVAGDNISACFTQSN